MAINLSKDHKRVNLKKSDPVERTVIHTSETVSAKSTVIHNENRDRRG